MLGKIRGLWGIQIAEIEQVGGWSVQVSWSAPWRSHLRRTARGAKTRVEPQGALALGKERARWRRENKKGDSRKSRL